MSVLVPNGEFVDYYSLLGVDVTASKEAIRAGFLQKAKASHPDAGGSTQQMQLLNQAYETLSGHLSRSAYDKLHGLHNSAPSDLDLREDGYDRPETRQSTDYDDTFVDQVYSEYYNSETKPKKKNWVKKFFWSTDE